MKRLAILTSGGDAPGMNAAVRAVTRTALATGAEVFGVLDGYQGLLEDRLVPLGWSAVSGILRQGGTFLGTARCPAMHERAGRVRAACNLAGRDIDRLVVVGGDGSLSGAEALRQEWTTLLQEGGLRAPERGLKVVGLPGSIDNDLWGTDMSIGVDTALARAVHAVDCIFSTAASHQRTFVVQVMGRRCGYLAMMTALATGAEWLLIPENPPDTEDWEGKMCQVLRAGREVGRRASIVILAEGARDRAGNPITAEEVCGVLRERLKEDARVTILGHVQRGGPPTAFDRNLSSLLGHRAAKVALEDDEGSRLVGLHHNRPHCVPLTECVERSRAVNEALDRGDYQQAVHLRGPSFSQSWETFRTLVRSRPRTAPAEGRSRRIGLLTAGGPAPGMNMAVRAAVRLLLDRGHRAVGVRRGFRGLVDNSLVELGWMSVSGWAPVGGSELGINREVPRGRELHQIARTLEDAEIDGLLVIGGWDAYMAAYTLHSERERFPVFELPMVCVPATIDNNLPGAELSLGADTALNNITEAVDKIKESAVASHRCFLVEVMGDHCGYLALLSGLASGAEKVYLHESGLSIERLLADLAWLRQGFESGRRVGLLIHNERAHPLYDTEFVAALFQEEGQFDVRRSILGHLQQGGTPTAFDRTQAVRMVRAAVDHLSGEQSPRQAFLGAAGPVDLADFPRLVDLELRRPRTQWWLELKEVADELSRPQEGFTKSVQNHKSP